jgi:hypothetical protein
MKFATLAIAACFAVFISQDLAGQVGGPVTPPVVAICGQPVSTSCASLVGELPDSRCGGKCKLEVTGANIEMKCEWNPDEGSKSEYRATSNVVQEIGAVPPGQSGNTFWSEGGDVVCMQKRPCGCSGIAVGNDIPCLPSAPDVTWADAGDPFTDWVPDGGTCFGMSL